jgi:uncharacterized membrane protein
MNQYLREQLPCHVLIACCWALGVLSNLERPIFLAFYVVIGGASHIAIYYRLKTSTNDAAMARRDLQNVLSELPDPEETWSTP